MKRRDPFNVRQERPFVEKLLLLLRRMEAKHVNSKPRFGSVDTQVAPRFRAGACCKH
jgi:hypothetical protein